MPTGLTRFEIMAAARTALAFCCNSTWNALTATCSIRPSSRFARVDWSASSGFFNRCDDLLLNWFGSFLPGREAFRTIEHRWEVQRAQFLSGFGAANPVGAVHNVGLAWIELAGV